MVSSGGGRSARARAREYKASGNKAMAAQSFQKAVRQYTRALELDPGNHILYSNRSAALFNMRQFAESLEDAESAILCDEKWWKAYKRKGLALIHMQRYQEAIEALEVGLSIIDKNAEMEKNLEFAKACQEQAQNLYILPEPHMMTRLESVPVFIVTDDVGQPFFVTYEDGQQVCTFYFDKEDADATLKWIQDENPDIGTTARVIHITLNQAFSLAQETQKQYYEETTRAAVEEDRAAAREASEKKKSDASKITDGDAEDNDSVSGSDDGAKKDSADDEGEASADTPVDDAAAAAKEAAEDEAADPAEATEASVDATKTAEAKEGDDVDALDDSVIDDNAPLSFQFRPELRQVQIAVELLNINPDPPVRPILRDPPSVKEAKAKAKAEAAAAAAADASKDEKNEEEDSGEKKEEDVSVEKKETKDEVVEKKEGDEKPSDDQKESGETEETKADKGGDEDEDDEELTVENFNGIPVFQAKGLTLLQNGQQLIPLFCSKWDLEAAWEQLVATPGSGVSGECEVEVGTLEDVLRRMSESKTKEFENVIFVPSRESMAAIGQRFPLDDLSSKSKQVTRPVVRRSNYSRAKEIKARGGTVEEVRAAVEEDLRRYRERQSMAEMVAQLNQASQGSESSNNTPAAPSRTAAAALSRRALASQKPMSGHDRRSAKRQASAARQALKAPVPSASATATTAKAATASLAGTKTGSAKMQFSQTAAPAPKKSTDAVAGSSGAEKATEEAAKARPSDVSA